jgi:hypothetical protein
MRRLAGVTVVAWLLMLAGSAHASAQTITTTVSVPGFPTSAPWTEPLSGTFQAAGPINDSGTVTGQAIFGAAPSPNRSAFQSTQTLTGALGTLTLRCTQLAKNFSDPTHIPSTGTCAVLNGTGAYAGLHGSGKLTGTADATATPPVLTDTVTL